MIFLGGGDEPGLHKPKLKPLELTQFAMKQLLQIESQFKLFVHVKFGYTI